MIDRKQIPTFDSYEAEAKFWDTHDVTDYWGELKPVEIRYSKKPTKPINVRFSDDSLRDIQAIAIQKGVGTTTLIRIWTLEKLHEEKKEKYTYENSQNKQDTSFISDKERN